MSRIATPNPAAPAPGDPRGGAGKPGIAPAKPAAPASSGGMPPISELQGRPIGRVLTKMGKVTRDQVVEALQFQKTRGKGIPLGRILADLGYIKETDLNIALAAQKGYELIDLSSTNI